VPEAAFVLSPAQPRSIRELAETVGHELRLQGVPARVYHDGFPEPAPDRVYVWLDPGGYLAAEGVAALPGDEILRRTILLYDEHRAPSADDHAQLELARSAGAVFCLDGQSRRALTNLGIPARIMRPGYSPALDCFQPDADRPIDITFIGTHTRRRTWALARGAAVLSRYPTAIHLIDGGSPTARPAPAARDPWPLLTQSKIALNLHCGESVDLEWRRVLDAIHAGAVVVSEHSTSLAPLVAGEHLLVASADAVPFVAESLLRDPERLARIRTQAYERLRSWMPFALPVSVLRAALVELVGEPVAVDSPRGAVRQPRGSAAAPVARRSADASVLTSAPAEGETVSEGPNWAHATPAVTIVVALGGATGDEAAATLASIDASVGPDAEVIVVDDGSPGIAVAVAHDWLTARPSVPWLLVRVRSGGVTSRGRSRNAGLAAARGAAALVLDGGTGLYPRGLAALAGALDQDERAALAYPLIEVTGDVGGFVEAGGDHLLNHGDWEPSDPCAGAPLQAPVLVRVGPLRALGGYTTDCYGGEDDGLRRRLAAAGLRGTLVPEIVAWRAVSEGMRRRARAPRAAADVAATQS
jgi:Glycosyl transferase family 2